MDLLKKKPKRMEKTKFIRLMYETGLNVLNVLPIKEKKPKYRIKE